MREEKKISIIGSKVQILTALIVFGLLGVLIIVLFILAGQQMETDELLKQEAIKEFDSFKCGDINTYMIRDDCYRILSQKLNTTMYCKYIQDERKKNLCLTIT